MNKQQTNESPKRFSRNCTYCWSCSWKKCYLATGWVRKKSYKRGKARRRCRELVPLFYFRQRILSSQWVSSEARHTPCAWWFVHTGWICRITCEKKDNGTPDPPSIQTQRPINRTLWRKREFGTYRLHIISMTFSKKQKKNKDFRVEALHNIYI